jgi:nucleotidyltransferase/DNA polymerase involved in DNA repair
VTGAPTGTSGTLGVATPPAVTKPVNRLGMLLSLDEAYLEVTENLQGIPRARDIALRIRERIKTETGLNASAGISDNKFLAKLASDHRKANGQFVILPAMGPAFVETLSVGKFHGIGLATGAKMPESSPAQRKPALNSASR